MQNPHQPMKCMDELLLFVGEWENYFKFCVLNFELGSFWHQVFGIKYQDCSIR